MRRDYGGVLVDLGDVVWFFDLWESYPVFHRAEMERVEEEEGGSVLVHVTGCGLRTRLRAGGLRDADALPPKHAVRIGRPCRTCWPELRRVLEIMVPGASRA